MNIFRKAASLITACAVTVTSLIAGSVPVSAASTKYDTYAYTESNTVSIKASLTTGTGYIYDQWSKCSPISDFIDNNGLYTIAYCDDSKVYICRTDNDLKIKKTISFKKRLPLVGGVICDKDGTYYVAYGQNDTKGKGGVKTVDIAKYDHNGSYVKSFEYYPDTKGTGSYDDYLRYTGEWATRQPFDAGNCVMAVSGGVLVCQMARGMYSGHQSCAVYAVNTKDMSQNRSIFTYTSHSFNQRMIVCSDGTFLFADHGDAYPRGFHLSTSASKDIVPFHFAGSTGDNKTGAQLGGICETSSGYVLVGTSVKGSSMKDKMQLFMQKVSKDLKKVTSSGSSRTVGGSTDTGVRWITDYSKYEVRNVNTAYLGSDKILIMYERYESGYKDTMYLIMSADGKILQSPVSLGTTRVNSCEELKYNSKDKCVYWTTADGNKKAVIHRLHIGDSIKISQISDKTYTGKKLKPSVTVKVGSTKLKSGTNYTVSYKNNTDPGTATVTITGKGKYSFSANATFTIKLKAPTAKVSGTALSWSKTVCPDKRWYKKDKSNMWYGYTGTEPDTYEIYRSVNGKDYKLYATVGGKTASYKLKDLKSGNTYKFKVRACVTTLSGSSQLSYKSPFSKPVTVKK